jgi:hypothetical protein
MTAWMWVEMRESEEEAETAEGSRERKVDGYLAAAGNVWEPQPTASGLCLLPNAQNAQIHTANASSAFLWSNFFYCIQAHLFAVSNLLTLSITQRR